MGPRTRVRQLGLGLAAILALAPASACRNGGPAADDESGETEGTDSGTSSTGGFTDPDACEASADCEEGSVCAAPWDPNAEPPRGPAACVAGCVEELDFQRFCMDDASCCEGLTCSVDGLCEPDWRGDTGSDTGTGSTDTDTGSTGSDTDTDTGSTSSDTGTDTGTGTGSTDTGSTGTGSTDTGSDTGTGSTDTGSDTGTGTTG